MARKCEISNKSSLRGNKVSHAHNKSRMEQRANLHRKRLFDPETGKWIRIRVSSRALRTIDKNGLRETLNRKRT